jgi:hypothetical protein
LQKKREEKMVYYWGLTVLSLSWYKKESTVKMWWCVWETALAETGANYDRSGHMSPVHWHYSLPLDTISHCAQETRLETLLRDTQTAARRPGVLLVFCQEQERRGGSWVPAHTPQEELRKAGFVVLKSKHIITPLLSFLGLWPGKNHKRFTS